MEVPGVLPCEVLRGQDAGLGPGRLQQPRALPLRLPQVAAAERLQERLPLPPGLRAPLLWAPPGLPQPCCTPVSSAVPLLWPCHNRNLLLPRARCGFVSCEPEGDLLLPSVTLSPLLCSRNVIYVDLFK